MRLLPDGQPDTSFGDGGASYESPPASTGVTALALLGDGRIVATGAATNVNGRDLVALGRYTADGRADAAFGSGGFVIDHGSVSPSALAVDDSGRLLTMATPDFSASGLVRYSGDGVRDTGFGLDGALGAIWSSSLEPGDLLLQPGGTAIAPLNDARRFGVLRFALDGPALAATAQEGRVCSGRVTTKSLTQLLRTGKSARFGKMNIVLDLRQPGGVRISAVARVGGRTARIGMKTIAYTSFGRSVATTLVSRAAARLLRPARSAQITLTATGTNGGATFSGTRTLKR
jgi:hypothetical protein